MKLVKAIFYLGTIFILVLTSCNQGAAGDEAKTDAQTKPEGQEVPKDSLVLLEELKSKRSVLDSQIQELETQLIQNGSLEPKFKEVIIGKQIWMAENLNVDKFRNGDPILEVMSGAEWEKVAAVPSLFDPPSGNEKPAWCYHGNDPENGTKFGKLYNWYAVNDKRGLAPKGWHIPTKKEWQELADYLGINEAGTKMKSRSGWGSGCYNTNSSGFSALPGGDRSPHGEFYGRGEAGTGERCSFWSSSEIDNDWAMYCSLFCEAGFLSFSNSIKGEGYSVRCIKD